MKLSSDDLPIRRSPTTEMDCGRDAPMREKILATSRVRPKNCARVFYRYAIEIRIVVHRSAVCLQDAQS